jgi:hypothetical protein
MRSVQILTTALISLASVARASGPPASRATSDDDVSAALRRVLPEVTYEDVALQRVLNDLCARLGTNTIIQSESLIDGRVDLEGPITLVLRQMPAEQVLRLALEEGGPDVALDLVIDEGVLRISTARSLERCVTQVYDIEKLFSVPPGEPVLRLEVREELRAMLLDMITGSVAPDSWEKAGGRGSIKYHGNALVAYNAPAVQRSLAALLDALVKVQRGGAAWTEPGWQEEDAANQPIWAALRSVVPQVSYSGVTLARFAADLRRSLGTNVHVFAHALDNAGMNADRQVALILTNVSVERMLREMLKQFGSEEFRLGWEVRNGVLLIGPAKYFGAPVARVYEAGDLIRTDELLRQLRESIEGGVAPDTWERAGGRGTLYHFRGRMVVYNGPSVHRDIERLLSNLRQRAGEAKAKP